MKIKNILLLLAFSLCTVSLFSQQQKQVKIDIKKVTNDIYMLIGQGGNIAIHVGEDGVLMIDDKFAHLTPKILEAIKSVTDKDVVFLVNSHWHGDHTGGNKNMHDEGAIIVAHENVRKSMSTDQFNKTRNRTTPASPEAALPVITFSKDISFHFNKEDMFIFHVHNAHTDGDAMIYFTKSNVLHTGDTYFQGKYPYIDLNSGGSIRGYINAIKQALLISNSETKIIPGHGNLSNKTELQTYVEMLEALEVAVMNEIKAGKTEEEVVENTAITKKYDDKKFGDGFISGKVLRRTLYRSLKKTQ